MSESAEAIRKDKEIEYSRQVFHKIELEKEINQQRLEDERNVLLQTIQQFIASNKYKDVLEITSSVKNLDFGSSSELYEFSCNIIFYRTIALGEHALSSLGFNSKEQHDTINEALDFAGIAMEASPEQRAGVRELASNLQQRVFARYIDGLLCVHRLYRNKEMGIDDDTNDYQLMNMIKCKEIDDAKKTASKEEVDGLLNQLITGFEFVVSITDTRRIPFDKALEFSYFGITHQSYQGYSIYAVDVCLRKTLTSFDCGHYDEALRLSETIAVFIKNHSQMLESVEKSMVGFVPQSVMITPSLLSEVASYVKNLVPVYQFANEKLQWRRNSGLRANGLEEKQALKNGHEFGDVITFINMLLSAFERSGSHIQHLVVSDATRTFVFDSFFDPIMMAEVTLERAFFDKNSENCKRVMSMLKQTAEDENMDEFLEGSHSAWAIFKKGKYDPIRVRLLQLSRTLLQLVQLFDNLLSINSYAKDQVMDSNRHVFYRYYTLPLVLRQCQFLMNVTFGGHNHAVRLLQHSIRIQADLDDADNFDLHMYGKDLIRETRLGSLDSPRLIRSHTIWTFSRVFNIFAPKFLLTYALGKDKMKLFVIDAIGNAPTLHLSRNVKSIEALAFDTINLVVEFGASYDHSRTSTALEEILKNEKNHDWCDSFTNSNHMKRWAKQKARKYSKLITRLLDNISSTVEITLCMTEWKKSVIFLLGMLQVSINKFRSIPPGLCADIEDTKDRTKIDLASQSLPQWSRKDLHNIRIHIIQLLEASEKVTGLLHRATGNMFPKVISIFHEKWKMNESISLHKGESHSKETAAVIQDIKYVNAILEEFQKHTNLSA